MSLSDAKAAPEPMLHVDSLEFAYDTTPVLQGASLQIARGEVVSLIGPNGGGKTTLLRAISGLQSPSSGSVRFGGLDITTLDAEDRVPLGLVTMFGGSAVFPELTVVENLDMGSELLRADTAARQERMDECLKLFPRLFERRQAKAVQLSGGEQQMLALAKAMVLQPAMLCIDELSLGLAPSIIADLVRALRRVAEDGTTILVVEQSLQTALLLSHRIGYFERGEVRCIETVDQVNESSSSIRALLSGKEAA